MQSQGRDSLAVAGVIMAGGKGTRFAGAGEARPKCLLPLRDGETLLGRLIRQIRDGGVTEVAVCCSPENHAEIAGFFAPPDVHSVRSCSTVRAIACASTHQGPIPALAEMVSGISAEWYLLAMADIFFAHGPFDRVLAQVANYPEADGIVVTGIDRMPSEGRGSGAVRAEGRAVRSIAYRPEVVSLETMRHWSGTFLFRSPLARDLLQHVGHYHGAPYEAWLQGLLDRKAHCIWMDAGPFVNVNSVREYEFLTSQPEDAHGH